MGQRRHRAERVARVNIWSECGCCGRRFPPTTLPYWAHLCWRMFLERPAFWWTRLSIAFLLWRRPELARENDQAVWGDEAE